MTVTRQLINAIGSESTKLSWRSPLWYAIVPAAVGIPIVLNGAIAVAAQMNKFNGGGGMDTNNAAYWIIIFSTFILMTGPVTSFSGEFGNRTVEIVFTIAPRRWLLPIAKLVVFGTVAAGASALTVFAILWGFPHIFPDVWGRVDLFSGTGVRLWLGIPILTVLVCALGLGLSVLIPRPSLVIILVLLWKFGVETFVGFVPGDVGLILQKFSPFKNAELGVGQMSSFDSVFGGPTGSLLYFAVLAVAIFALGLIRLTRADVRSG
ncbi:MAG: ABC transporter permease [Gordonia sp. (in: high G+C Gram-positive bacteria)]